MRSDVAARKPLRWAAALAGALLVSTIVPAGAVEDLPTGVSSNDLLVPSALDDRLADDGVTPIAVSGGTAADGTPIIYGARESTTPEVADLSRPATGTRYFVDCSDSGGGTGTKADPFTTLDEINAVVLGPGDEVLFRRGAACTGMFRPQGSGSPEADVVVDAYDAAAGSMARIDGAGAPQAVLLDGVEHYTVRNLELTNFTGDGRDYTEQRRGLTVTIADIGVGTGYTITDLYIHDVLGNNKKDRGGSGGIQFEVEGSKVPTKFSEVEIAHNTIRHVNRSGINMGTTWWARNEAEPGSEQWQRHHAWDPFHVHDNVVTDIGGDGIVIQYASGSRVEHNTVENVSNGHDGSSVNGVNAAVWPWNADRVEFRYNHVFGTVRLPDNNDGMAFNADTGNTGGIYEYNLSHDNEGGFMMFCGCWGMSTNSTVRYNVSLNDGREVMRRDGSGGLNPAIARTFFMAGQTDGAVYNNTILLPSSPVDIAHPDRFLADNVVMANNVFLAQEDTVVQETATAVPFSAINWRNNVFGGTDEGWPVHNVTGNLTLPDLTLAAGQGLERLAITDSRLVRAGVPIADEGQLDVAGRPVPWVTAPDVGAHQLSAVEADAQRVLFDGGFELAQGSTWQLGRAAERVTDGQRSGTGALALGADGAATTQVTAAVNRTYRLVAAVQAQSSGDLPSVSVTLPSGDTVTAEPAGQAGPDGYVEVAAVFRTAFDATSLEVAVAADGAAGLVDDVSLLTVEDLMVDGAFEAAKNTVWQEVNNDTGPFPRSTDAVTGDLAAPVTPSAPATNRYTYVTPGLDYELGVWGKSGPSASITLGWTNTAGQSGSTTSTAPDYERMSVPLTSSTSKVTVSCSGEGTCDDMTLVEGWDGTVPAVPLPTTEPPAVPSPVIPQELVSVHDVSSEQTAQYPGLAEYTLDGDPQTMWHNDWAVTDGPHHISFDLGAEYAVDSLVYTPRQTASRNGVLKDYEVYVTGDPGQWGEPVAAGTLADTREDSVLDLGDAVGRYVRLVYLDSYNDNGTMTNATAAEISFTGVPR